jgi:hypothetical protein
MEETMPDARRSAVSRILRLLALEPAVDEKPSREDEDDRSQSATEIERKLSQRDEAFFWTWQYPGQW